MEGVWTRLQQRSVCVEGGIESVSLKGKLLSLLVTDCSHFLQRYDPRHNRWFQIQSLQQEHADLCVCVVGKYIYAVAGRDYHNDLSAVERYDPATNSWDYVAPLKREVRKPSNRSLPSSLPWAILRGPHLFLLTQAGRFPNMSKQRDSETGGQPDSRVFTQTPPYRKQPWGLPEATALDLWRSYFYKDDNRHVHTA